MVITCVLLFLFDGPAAKVRRLYDIANVLTTLGLIRKKTFMAPNHRKMPGYSWAGPSLDQIKTIRKSAKFESTRLCRYYNYLFVEQDFACNNNWFPTCAHTLPPNAAVFRKSEANLYPFYSRRKGNGGGGSSLTRKPSFGSMRPFLHQYEVKVDGSHTTSNQPNSAPSSPLKSKGSGFKRSLSFGAGPPRKVLPKQPLTQSSLAAALMNQKRSDALSQPLMQNQKRSDGHSRQESVPGTSVVTTPISMLPAKCVVARQRKFWVHV